VLHGPPHHLFPAPLPISAFPPPPPLPSMARLPWASERHSQKSSTCSKSQCPSVSTLRSHYILTFGNVWYRTHCLGGHVVRHIENTFYRQHRTHSRDRQRTSWRTSFPISGSVD
jgi:hypothetical protein